MLGDLLASAGTLWRYWDNPFLVRSLRSDWRGRSWVSAFAVQFGVLAALVWIISLFGAVMGPAGFADWWGGSWGGVAVVFTACVHFFMVRRGAAAGRRRELLTDEARQGTLEPILVTPMSRAEIIVKSSVYSFLWAGIVAFVVLPVYCICAAVGDVPASGLLGLYALYAVLAFRPPVRLRHSVLAHTVSQQVLGTLLLVVMLLTLMIHMRGGFWRAVHSGGIVFTWVWELASWLGKPAPFYGFGLPPLVLMLLLYPLHVWCGVLLAASELEPGGSRYPAALTKLRYWYRLLLGVAVLGLLWQPVFVDGDLASVMGLSGSAAGAAAFALAAAATLLGGTELLETARTRGDMLAGMGIRLRFGHGAWAHLMGGVGHSVSGLLALPVVHLVGCALGGEDPYGGGASGALGASLASSGAALVLCYSIGVFLWLMLAKRRWLYGASYHAVLALLVGLPTIGLCGIGGAAGGLLAGVSPLAGFAAVTGYGARWFPGALTDLPTWQVCVRSQLLVAGLMLVLNATVLGRRLESGSRRAGVGPATWPVARRVETPGLLERIATRWDNPITVQACRLSARSGGAFVMPVLAVLAVLGGVSVALSSPFTPHPLALWTDFPGGAEPLGWRVAMFVSFAAGLLLAVYAVVSGGTAFAEDRRRQAFGFVLVTPMSDSEVVDGWARAMAMPAVVAVALAAVVSLVGAALAVSAMTLVQWAFMTAWSVFAAAAAGYAAMGGALWRTVSDARAIVSGLLLLGLLEGGRLVVAAISRAAAGTASGSGSVVIAALFGTLTLAGAALVAIGCRAMAHGALAALRRSDPFAA